MANLDYYIPPNLRNPLRQGAGAFMSLLDNVIGLDNEYESAGERFGRQVRQDPIGTAKAVGSGILEGVGNFVSDPVGTVSDMATEFGQSYNRASQGAVAYLPQGVTLKDATPAQINAANEAFLSDLTALSAVVPAGRLGKSVGNAAGDVANVVTDFFTGFTGGAKTSVGDMAAKTYRVGDALEKAGNFKGAAGKPDAVNIPDAGKFAAKPISEIEKAAVDYMRKRGMDTTAFDEYPPFSEERARMIAAAYDMMAHAPDDKTVKRAYDAMIQETLDQYNSLRESGIDFKFLKEGMSDPYERSPAMGYQDLVENGRLWVYPTDFGFGTSASFDPKQNPLLQKVGKIGDKPDAVANDAFRAVHDAFGHFGSGNPFFRHKGEERAFLEHSRMYSPEARGAMTSETRGQNSWLNFGPYGESNRVANTGDTQFADQKTGLMPSWTWDPRGMPDEEQAQSLLRYFEKAGRK